MLQPTGREIGGAGSWNWLDGLDDDPRPGGVPSLTADQVEKVVVDTLKPTPANARRWSQVDRCNGKMPNDRWQQFANLRALLTWMWAHPGRPPLFMAGEIAQNGEWRHDSSFD